MNSSGSSAEQEQAGKESPSPDGGVSEMVERVAKAIYAVQNCDPDLEDWDGLSESWHDGCREMARAAIEAMMAPTDDMIEAAITALPRWRENLPPDDKMLRHVIKDGRGFTEATVPEKHAIRYRAMIGAALSAPERKVG